MRSTDNPMKSPAYKNAALALVGTVAVILTALAFEYIGGYRPCPLCLQQRWAYYAAIPALFIGLILLSSDKLTLAGVVFLLVSILFLLNAGLGVYHAGAEWKYWPGPDTCGGTGQALSTGGNLLDKLKNVQVIRCDEAPWRFLGLSFAGWNVVTSVLLWITSQTAAFATSALRATR